MVLLVEGERRPLGNPALRSMCEARKRIFVDLLQWNVPVIDGRFEVDRFDDEHAVYLIVTDEAGAHLGSARLLETMRPHILDTLFDGLCANGCPKDRATLEITRFCLDRKQDARQRRATRNMLVSALVDYALERGVARYSGVAEMVWFQQILAFGWRCRPLGLPRLCGGKLLAALLIDVEENTPALLAGNGIYRPVIFERAAALEAA